LAGVPPECGIAAEKLPQADPAPYGMARLEELMDGKLS